MLSPQISRVRFFDKEVKDRRNELNKAENLLRNRTNYVEIISEINKRVPDYIWLNEIKAENGDKGDLFIILTGFSIYEPMVTTFISQLEQISHKKNLNLLYSKKQDRQKIFKKWKIHSRGWYEFKIKMVI